MRAKEIEKVGILGCGWLGLPLAQQLVKLGFSVNGSTTQIAKREQIAATGARAFIVQCEEKHTSGLAAFLHEVDCLIITLPPGIRANPMRRFDRVIETIRTEALKHKIQKVIFTSSTSVYGKTEGIIKEDTPAAAVTKSGEQLLKCEQLLLNTPVFNTTIVRFGGLVGPNRHPIFTLAKREKLDNPTGKINYIHLDDCINLICRCLLSSSTVGVYNGVSPYHPSRKEYFTVMAKKAGLILPPFSDINGIDRMISSQKAERKLGMDFTVENLLTLN